LSAAAAAAAAADNARLTDVVYVKTVRRAAVA